LVAAMEKGQQEESLLVWYDVEFGRQLRNVTLGRGSSVDSLSMSHNASLVALSGVAGNYTFIYAFDSQGNQLWKHLIKAEGIVSYHEFSYVRSNVAVSEDGLYVAAALREMTVRFGFSLNTDGFCYFVRSASETKTVIASTSSTALWIADVGMIQTVTAILLVGGLGLVALLFIIRSRSRAKTRGD